MSFASLVEPVPHESRSEEESSEEWSENSPACAPDALCEGAGVVVVVLERRVGSAPCDLVGRAAVPVQGVPVAARIEPSVDQPVPFESGRLSGLSSRLSSA